MGALIKVYKSAGEFVIIDENEFPGSKWERIGYRKEVPKAEPPPRRTRRRTVKDAPKKGE